MKKSSEWEKLYWSSFMKGENGLFFVMKETHWDQFFEEVVIICFQFHTNPKKKRVKPGLGDSFVIMERECNASIGLNFSLH